MPRLFGKIFRSIALYHWLIPLVVGLGIDTVIGWRRGLIQALTLTDLANYWFSADRVGSWLSVYVVFALVFLFYATGQAKVRTVNLGILNDILPTATQYFAIGATPLKDWFEPAVQAYLSKIAAHKFATPQFDYVRVLPFFSRGALSDARASYLDEHYARCFNSMHKSLHISLAFLRPREVFEILNMLNLRERRILGCYRPSFALLPEPLLRLIPLRWTPNHGFAFAWLEYKNGTRSIVQFHKRPESLDISEITNSALIPTYERVVAEIKRRIYLPNSHTIRSTHDFGEYLET